MLKSTIRVSKSNPFCYAELVKSSMSIVLFFLLSGFFLATLLGSVERSRKLLAVAGALLVVLACIVVFLRPVQLPSLSSLRDGTANAIFLPSTSSSLTTSSTLENLTAVTTERTAGGGTTESTRR